VGRTRQERDILERSVHSLANRAADAYRLVDQLFAAGFADDHPPMIAAKTLRIELLGVKGDIEWELAGGWRTAGSATGGSTGSVGGRPGRASILPGVQSRLRADGFGVTTHVVPPSSP
jgi:hypothetical protein